MSEENKEETQEEESTHRLNRKQRIKLFKLKQSLGFLPKKPEARIAGKHEYIRLEQVNEYYFTKIEHKLVPKPECEYSVCEVCSLNISSQEDVEKGLIPPCSLVNNPSQLDLKLTELKVEGRKVLNVQREWGGWTIKMMANRA